MDVTGFDVGAFGAAIGSIIAAAKGLMSANKAESRAKSIEDDRIATKMKRDSGDRTFGLAMVPAKRTAVSIVPGLSWSAFGRSDTTMAVILPPTVSGSGATSTSGSKSKMSETRDCALAPWCSSDPGRRPTSLSRSMKS